MFFWFFKLTLEDNNAYEPDLKLLLDDARVIFQAILWPIIIIGLIGNSAVLIRIIFEPTGRFLMLKPFYRCALLSFAISDLMLLIASGTNTLTSISYSTNVLWRLPDWSCTALPYVQTVAIFIGSLTLAGIAIDRYRALTPNYPTTEVYDWPYAIFFNVLIWIIAMAASYPILGIYEIKWFDVYTEDFDCYRGRVCATDQEQTALVYTALFVTIFAPLAVIFLTVHVLLALNIWRRQEQSNKSQLSSGNDSQSTEFSTVSNSAEQKKRQLPRPITSNHIRRKKRTVNVILVLIMVFLVGRLPVWIFLLFKLHTQLKGNLWHHLQIVFTGLTFLNAALDPFLYAFLCEALSLLTFLQTCRGKKKEFKAPAEDIENKVAVQARSTIVPRGPYNF